MSPAAAAEPTMARATRPGGTPRRRIGGIGSGAEVSLPRRPRSRRIAAILFGDSRILVVGRMPLIDCNTLVSPRISTRAPHGHLLMFTAGSER